MAVNNSLAKRQEGGTLSAYLANDAVKRKINEMVGGKDGQRFITSIISAAAVNPALAQCRHDTILSAAMLGEALKLSPSPQLGQYYMIPFENRKEGYTAAQFVLGYKGYIQLAIRSGYYKKLNVMAIKEGELISFDPLNEAIEVNLIQDDIERENAKTIGYYAMFEYQNGFRKVLYWSFEKMLTHADKYSKAFSREAYQKILDGKIPEKDQWKYSSFWYKDFDGMAYKTMLRQLISKWGIMSIEMQQAIDGDCAVISDDGTPDYVEDAASEQEPATREEEVTDVECTPAEQTAEATFFDEK